MTRFFLSLMLAGSVVAAPAPSFPPLNAWRQAVLNGDRTALASMYWTDPRHQFVAGKQPVSLDDEVAFWSGLHAAGVSQFDPKILSIEHKEGAVQLVLRVMGQMQDGRHFVASVSQVWADFSGVWNIVISNRSDIVQDTGRSLPEPAHPNPNLYSPPAEGRHELQLAEQRAMHEHKRVLVVFGANWCYDCHVLDTTLRSTEFAPMVNANYVVVHISIGDDGKENNDLAAQLGVVLDKGIPALAVLDPSGHVITAQKNGEFESTVRIGPADVRAFLDKYKPH